MGLLKNEKFFYELALELSRFWLVYCMSLNTFGFQTLAEFFFQIVLDFGLLRLPCTKNS